VVVVADDPHPTIVKAKARRTADLTRLVLPTYSHTPFDDLVDHGTNSVHVARCCPQCVLRPYRLRACPACRCRKARTLSSTHTLQRGVHQVEQLAVERTAKPSTEVRMFLAQDIANSRCHICQFFVQWGASDLPLVALKQLVS
jgi:hypothetical protein